MITYLLFFFRFCFGFLFTLLVRYLIQFFFFLAITFCKVLSIKTFKYFNPFVSVFLLFVFVFFVNLISKKEKKKNKLKTKGKNRKRLEIKLQKQFKCATTFLLKGSLVVSINTMKCENNYSQTNNLLAKL